MGFRMGLHLIENHGEKSPCADSSRLRLVGFATQSCLLNSGFEKILGNGSGAGTSKYKKYTIVQRPFRESIWLDQKTHAIP